MRRKVSFCYNVRNPGEVIFKVQDQWAVSWKKRMILWYWLFCQDLGLRWLNFKSLGWIKNEIILRYYKNKIGISKFKAKPNVSPSQNRLKDQPLINIPPDHRVKNNPPRALFISRTAIFPLKPIEKVVSLHINLWNIQAGALDPGGHLSLVTDWLPTLFITINNFISQLSWAQTIQVEFCRKKESSSFWKIVCCRRTVYQVLLLFSQTQWQKNWQGNLLLQLYHSIVDWILWNLHRTNFRADQNRFCTHFPDQKHSSSDLTQNGPGKHFTKGQLRSQSHQQIPWKTLKTYQTKTWVIFQNQCHLWKHSFHQLKL